VKVEGRFDECLVQFNNFVKGNLPRGGTSVDFV
jgi:hypothetical protein